MPDNSSSSAPFEGPEKLLEIWFAPSASAIDHQGLRAIDRKLWEQVLEIVKCKILSVIQGSDIDAYLLRHVLIPLHIVSLLYHPVNLLSSFHLIGLSSKPAEQL